MDLIDHARAELKRINFGDDDSRVLIEILARFFDQWDSGGAVSVAAPMLQRLIAGKPLSPLTGAADEWIIHDASGCYAQNKRCSSVFRRDKDGEAHDIDAVTPGPITFPYMPCDAGVKAPVFEV
jgi:hypothetical protein